MFGKKPIKTPSYLSKMPPAPAYQEQYSSEQQSQLLTEDIDPNYEPTPRQIKEYAIQKLGMSLPEDQKLFYLAKEGLKAPLPSNWEPYQSRDGSIYYKDKITQQKMSENDHPTDALYRKKYQELKEKAARNNLKSISLKHNLGMQANTSLVSGLGLMNNNSSLGLGKGLSLGQVGMGDDHLQNQVTIDQEIAAEYQKQVEEYEKKQEKQWREYEKEIEAEHSQKIKKIKEDIEEEKARLQGKGNSSRKNNNSIEDQQNKILKSLEEEEENTLNQQLKVFTKDEENKLEEYKTVYEEDNQIKLKKIEHQLKQNYEEKLRLLEEKLKKIEQKKNSERQSRQKILRQTRQDLQKSNNSQIAVLLKAALEDKLKGLKQHYARKIQQKQEELNHQVNQMKKVLGIDKSQSLLALANRKEKLLNLSNMKILSKRNKEIQIIENQTEKQLQIQKEKLKQKIAKQHEQKLQAKKKQQQDKLQKAKTQIEKQYLERSAKSIEELYENSVAQKNNYQANMNKKMSQLRMKFINQLSDQPKKQRKQAKILNRVLIQEKQNQVANKEQLLKTLQRQLELERKQYRVLQFDSQIYKAFTEGTKQDINQFLKQKMRVHGVTYKSAQLKGYIEQFSQLKQKCKQEKKLLSKIVRVLQDSAAQNLYEMRKSSLKGDGNTVSSGAMVRKYNEDVRKVRQNQDLLNNFQSLLKKAEMGGSNFQENMQKLRKFVQKMDYKQITLKKELQRQGFKSKTQISSYKQFPQNIEQYEQKQQKKAATAYNWTSDYKSTNANVEQTLRDHSRFLKNVRNQLNRKLYQVRFDSKY